MDDFTDGADTDEESVRSLLRAQHPDLAHLPLRLVAGGWANRMWRLGDELAVRLPRTTTGPSRLRHEQRWLPELAPRLPLPVPAPVRAGEPSEVFPRAWAVTRWVRGEPGDRAAMDRAADSAVAMAGFLRALHRPAPAEAPSNPGRGIPLRKLTSRFEERFAAVAPVAAPDGRTRELRDVWEEGVASPEWAGPPVWLHADLHPANVVVSGGTLSGVVDFGELCSGDPAADLSAAWLALPGGAAARFFDAYGEADTATVRRAKGWAVLHALSLVDIGRAGRQGLPGGQPTWEPAGRRALAGLLA
ncbi:aminoglycoside phosphotransferase family protein [Streptomyces ovatisporus]|uniref:Aminoglycoside phosphotransferase family protein n=1 Tax=Streptomyces ovatisporus TaxID=1128682 RepID=A0ABV9A6R9_9ACTN